MKKDKETNGTIHSTGFKGEALLGEVFLQGRDAMSLPPIDLAVFHENGYLRKQCTITGLWFWTTDESRETCGDTAEDEYSFIGAPLIQGYPMRGKAIKDAMRDQDKLRRD